MKKIASQEKIQQNRKRLSGKLYPESRLHLFFNVTGLS